MSQSIPDIVFGLLSAIGGAIGVGGVPFYREYLADKRLTKQLEREGRTVEKADPRDNLDPFGKRNAAATEAERQLSERLATATKEREALAKQVTELAAQVAELAHVKAEASGLRESLRQTEKRMVEQGELIKEFESGAIYSRLESEIRTLKEKLDRIDSNPTPLVPATRHVNAREDDARRTDPVLKRNATTARAKAFPAVTNKLPPPPRMPRKT